MLSERKTLSWICIANSDKRFNIRHRLDANMYKEGLERYRVLLLCFYFFVFVSFVLFLWCSCD